MRIVRSGENNNYYTISIDSVGELYEVTPRNFNMIVLNSVQYVINRFLTEKGGFMYYVTVWVFDDQLENCYKVYTSYSYQPDEADAEIRKLVNTCDSLYMAGYRNGKRGGK